MDFVNLFWCIIGALIPPLFVFLKERWINRKSPLSGTWGQFIYSKDDIEYKNDVKKRDEYNINHSLLMLYSQHIRINLNGSIFRIKDASEATNSNSEKRNWKCTGYINGEILMLFYKAAEPYDTKGCVYTKLVSDNEYKGYYLADHKQSDGTKKIDMTPVKLIRYSTKYALFDWDNTIGTDYTIFSWVDYLYSKGKFDEKIRDEIYKKADEYKSNKFTHDEYANQVGILYAKGIEGQYLQEIEAIAKEYVDGGNLQLYPEIDKLFNTLRKKKIKIIIITGTPYEIINCYRKRFNIDSIYALRAESVGNKMTGNVEHNYGLNKELIVERLIHENDQIPPYMAFGDSESDYPMLKKALYPFYISSKLSEETNGFIFIDRDNVAKQVIRKIQKRK